MGSCSRYRSCRPIHSIPIIRRDRWIRAALVNSYAPEEARENHRSRISIPNSYFQTSAFQFRYRSGRPVRRGPIIRCDRWIRAALLNAHTPKETRETHRNGASAPNLYFHTCVFLFPPLSIGPPNSLRPYNSLR